MSIRPCNREKIRFLRILKFVIEVENRNNELIWVYPGDMGIIGIVFLRWSWIYKNIRNPSTQSWEKRILVNSIVHNQILYCFFSLKTEFWFLPISHMSWVIYYDSWLIRKVVLCIFHFKRKIVLRYHQVSVESRLKYSLNHSRAPPRGLISWIFSLNINDVISNSDMTSFFMTHSFWVI